MSTQIERLRALVRELIKKELEEVSKLQNHLNEHIDKREVSLD